MTTIIGIQKPDHCLLVADSRITDDSGRTYTHPVVTKITKRGKFLIVGYSKMGLEYCQIYIMQRECFMILVIILCIFHQIKI